LQIVVVAQRLLDQGPERPRAKERPPGPWNVAATQETLCRARRVSRGYGLRGHPAWRVAADARRPWALEIGADRTAGEEHNWREANKWRRRCAAPSRHAWYPADD